MLHSGQTSNRCSVYFLSTSHKFLFVYCLIFFLTLQSDRSLPFLRIAYFQEDSQAYIGSCLSQGKFVGKGYCLTWSESYDQIIVAMTLSQFQ